MTQAAENSGGADQPLTAGASFKVSATDDALCPLCQYNLRGLQEPRCPECGYRFTWEEVLDPSRRLHPYLYEHRPDAEYDIPDRPRRSAIGKRPHDLVGRAISVIASWVSALATG